MSGAFSQSAIDLEGTRETGVNVKDRTEKGLALNIRAEDEEDVCLFYTERDFHDS